MLRCISELNRETHSQIRSTTPLTFGKKAVNPPITYVESVTTSLVFSMNPGIRIQLLGSVWMNGNLASHLAHSARSDPNPHPVAGLVAPSGENGA